MNDKLRKYPAVFAVIPVAMGILVSNLLSKEIFILDKLSYKIIILILFSACIISYALMNKVKIFTYTYFITLFLIGFVSFQYRYYSATPDNISEMIKHINNDKIILRGVIAESPDIKSDKIRILLDDISIGGQKADGMVLASIYKNKYKESELKDVRYGSVVEIDGQLEKLPSRRNPGEFDYGLYLKMHDIDAVFYSYGYENLKLDGKTQENFYKSKIIDPVKEYSINTIDKYVGGDEGEYLKGLVLGERSNISKEIKENFVNAGVAHIIAVSGLNVAYVLIMIWGILMFIPIKQNYKIYVSIILLLFYMNLTGNSPSIVRATIMASVFLLAQVFERKTNPYNVTSLAALIIILVDPRQLFDPGFILSFSAILSIVIFYPKIEEWLMGFKWYANLNTEKISSKFLKFILALFFGTLAAQIGTLPITAIMFKKISIVSLVANLFSIPLSNISLAIGFVVIIVSLFSSWLASVFASFNILLMFGQLKSVEYCAKLDYAYFETYFVDAAFLVVYFLIIIILFTASVKNIVPRAVIVVLISLNFVVFNSLAGLTGKVKLTYINVGNLNSTLIKMPQGTNILINAGGSTDKYFSAERNIIPYLKREGVNYIDLLFINSLNINELKNLEYLVEHFDIKRIIIPIFYQSIFDINSVAEKFKKISIDFVTEPSIINQKGNFRVYIYYNSELKGEAMMTEFVYGEQSFIFNDSYNLLDDYINTAYVPQENALMILKVSGFGSFNYNSADFIARAEPEFIVISSSDKGRKKADSDLFKSSLEEAGYTVLRTGEEGAVIFETDGYTTNRVMWR